ncbi:conserved hypothetical protein [Alteracholeplasma palmae J233]|uniref:AB hydrolase-1 domain-containing protein n=1 Tax=Alteracholeplasma palmae (strain ATCC 49389 / J233) TaxID=1318466 RepID=U4KL66_ALTPJ|nr:alpha/beta fold hydrolase [Alteracholeplasma palmae]CCV64488.1 conserved hypothetical protein [Alteracholeplasma palmae J233]
MTAIYVTVGILVSLLAFFITSQILFKLIFGRDVSSNSDKLIPKRLQPDIKIMQVLEKENAAWLENITKEHLWIETKFGNANAFYIGHEKKSSQLVVLIHGYRANKKQLNSMANYYYEKENVDVLLVELLGHGQSDSEYINFGYYDHKYIINLIQSLRAEHDYQVYVHGCSMGSVIALWIGSVYPVSGIIADSPYGRLKDNMKDNIPYIVQPITFLFTLFIGRIAKKRLGFYVNDINILDKVENISTKTLLISGLNDKIVKSKHIKKIQKHMKIIPDVWYIEDCPHLGAYVLKKDEYQERIHNMLVGL